MAVEFDEGKIYRARFSKETTVPRESTRKNFLYMALSVAILVVSYIIFQYTFKKELPTLTIEQYNPNPVVVEGDTGPFAPKNQ